MKNTALKMDVILTHPINYPGVLTTVGTGDVHASLKSSYR